MRRFPSGVVALAALLGVASLAPAPPPVAAAPGAAVVYPMVFPLVGAGRLTDSFGDPRGKGRKHAGVDILADRMTPVVAVADGEVAWLHDGSGGHTCCALALRHDDGWRSRYVHLNDDTPGTDDGRAVGIVPGLRKGTRVTAGQVIGWVGDSGNAEETVPHLHFELRRPDGTAVDPLPSLRAARARGRELTPPPRRRGAAPPAAPPAPQPAPPLPGTTGEPPAPEGSAGLEMDHEVEVVTVDDDCCGNEVGAEEEAAESGRRSWLACFGFTPRRSPAENGGGGG